MHLENSHTTNADSLEKARPKLAFEVIYKRLLCKLLAFFENLTQWESTVRNNYYHCCFSSTSAVPITPVIQARS